jgi:chromosomal replication initiator protein
MKPWKDFLQKQEKFLGKQTIEKWLSSLKIVKYDSCNLYLEAKDSFQVLWFEEHIRPLINEEFINNNGRSIKVHLSLENDKFNNNQILKKQKQKFVFQITEETIDPYKTFSSFFASDQNMMPYKLLNEITSDNQPNDLPTFNPIFIYGNSGNGKTHLLMAAAHAFKSQGKKTFYVRAETFTSQVVQSIRFGEIEKFRKEYRNIDVLIIDDIHILANKNATQEEFFHTFNALHTSSKQIILSANISTQQLKGIEQRLISRFEWGISLEVKKMDTSNLYKFIKNRASFMGLDLSEEQVNFFISSFNKKINKIQQAIEALTLHCHINSIKNVSLEQIKTILKDLILIEKTQPICCEQIVKAVFSYYGIKKEDILGKSHAREYSLPRQIAIYLLREKLHWPFKKIGQYFSRDHSTIISSVKLIEEALKSKEKRIYISIKEIIHSFDNSI